MEPSDPLLLVVCGPTASGKTNFAIDLAQHLKTEIISADSRQVYREMTIGTAKPTLVQLESVPHHFINIRSVTEEYNAGTFENEALTLLDKLFQVHRVVVVAGGTGLYLRALCEGLDALPPANPTIRAELSRELDEHGVNYLFKKLQALDLKGSQLVDANNPHRIMRAIELVMQTGNSVDELWLKKKAKRPFRILKILMNPERQQLYKNINQRVDHMLEQGLLEEVQGLVHFKKLKALNTVGYKEIFEYLDKKCSLEHAVDKIKQHTRNYAKRQLTWFNSETDVIPHSEFNLESLRA